jgi:hypothetical protein
MWIWMGMATRWVFVLSFFFLGRSSVVPRCRRATKSHVEDLSFLPLPPQPSFILTNRTQPPTHRHRGSFRDSRDNANAVYRPDGTFRGDSFRDSNANANGGGFREREPANGNSFRDQRDREPSNSFRSDGGSGSFRDGGFRDASHGGVFREGGFRDGEQERERERAHGLGQSFLAPASANTNNNSHSGGRGEGFRGVG